MSIEKLSALAEMTKNGGYETAVDSNDKAGRHPVEVDHRNLPCHSGTGFVLGCTGEWFHQL